MSETSLNPTPSAGEPAAMAVPESVAADTVADLAVLGKMLHEHRPALLAMLERRIDPTLATRVNAEDVLSEAFLEARRKWAWFKQQAAYSAHAWLYRICLDSLIATWRRESRGVRDVRRDFPLPDHSSVCLGLGLVQTGTSPSAGAARQELQERMRQALALLKPADRELLWMRHYDDLAFADIAQLLEINETAARVRYVRALKKLEGLWARLYPVTGGGA